MAIATSLPRADFSATRNLQTSSFESFFKDPIRATTRVLHNDSVRVSLFVFFVDGVSCCVAAIGVYEHLTGATPYTGCFEGSVGASGLYLTLQGVTGSRRAAV